MHLVKLPDVKIFSLVKQGNSHVVYNGSFYFHQRNTSNLIKYDLLTNTAVSKPIPSLSYRGPNYLYTDGRDYLDLNVDENGLWGIYGLEETNNNTIIMKIDQVTLTVNKLRILCV